MRTRGVLGLRWADHTVHVDAGWWAPSMVALVLLFAFLIGALFVEERAGKVRQRRRQDEIHGVKVPANQRPSDFRPKHRHADLELRTALLRPPLRQRATGVVRAVRRLRKRITKWGAR